MQGQRRLLHFAMGIAFGFWLMWLLMTLKNTLETQREVEILKNHRLIELPIDRTGEPDILRTYS